MPKLLNYALEENKYEEFVRQFAKYYEYITASKIQVTKLFSADTCDAIHRTFCEVFSTLPPELAFESVFNTWLNIEGDRSSLTLKLVENYQKAHPHLSLKFLEKGGKKGMFQLVQLLVRSFGGIEHLIIPVFK